MLLADQLIVAIAGRYRLIGVACSKLLTRCRVAVAQVQLLGRGLSHGGRAYYRVSQRPFNLPTNPGRSIVPNPAHYWAGTARFSVRSAAAFYARFHNPFRKTVS
jgi:hypothetical protein